MSKTKLLRICSKDRFHGTSTDFKVSLGSTDDLHSVYRIDFISLSFPQTIINIITGQNDTLSLSTGIVTIPQGSYTAGDLATALNADALITTCQVSTVTDKFEFTFPATIINESPLAKQLGIEVFPTPSGTSYNATALPIIFVPDVYIHSKALSGHNMLSSSTTSNHIEDVICYIPVPQIFGTEVYYERNNSNFLIDYPRLMSIEDIDISIRDCDGNIILLDGINHNVTLLFKIWHE